MNSSIAYVEHSNICVEYPEKTIRFILSAIPSWKIRGQGETDWFGKTIQWFHVGSHESYIAIQSGGSGTSENWKGLWIGIKHVGIVVQSIDAVVKNLEASGFEIDHYGVSDPFRRNVYFLEDHGIQFEFIEYLSKLDSERNIYI